MINEACVPSHGFAVISAFIMGWIVEDQLWTIAFSYQVFSALTHSVLWSDRVSFTSNKTLSCLSVSSIKLIWLWTDWLGNKDKVSCFNDINVSLLLSMTFLMTDSVTLRLMKWLSAWMWLSSSFSTLIKQSANYQHRSSCSWGHSIQSCHPSTAYLCQVM